MVDDLGWRDLSAYGSETYETPHLDRLVERGMLFTESYSASPLCSPTRAATLTGQTVGRLRITIPQGHFDHVVLDPSEGTSAAPGLPMTQPGNRTRLPLETFTLGNLFQNAGYKTAFLGKWHLGHYPFIPENFGFDYVVGGRATHGPPGNRFFGPWDPETSKQLCYPCVGWCRQAPSLWSSAGHPTKCTAPGDSSAARTERRSR
jgi:arylsulfatase A-like enzyme